MWFRSRSGRASTRQRRCAGPPEVKAYTATPVSRNFRVCSRWSTATTSSAFAVSTTAPPLARGRFWEWTNLDEIAECSNQNYAEGAWASRAYVDKADIFAPVFTSQFTANDTGSSWRTQVTPYGDATQIRVTFAAGQSGGGWSTLHCSVGTWAGVNANTNATPVELKFGGASGFTIATGGTITSDWLTFSVTGGTRIVIITDQAPPYSVAAYNSSSTGADPPFGSEFWYKVTDTSWNVASPTGYTQVTNVAVGMRLIEGKGGSTIVAGVSSSAAARAASSRWRCSRQPPPAPTR